MSKDCMIKGCKRTKAADKRGLCLVCYSKAKALVDEGGTTWEKLEALGLCKEQHDPFGDAYTQAMEDN